MADLMEDFALYTSDMKLVWKVQIPTFTPKADVLLWGSRVFLWNMKFQAYVEGFAYWVPNIEGLNNYPTSGGGI